jgi:3-hydroxyisobutyrate dehydrogenase-like beta-hydroxyacid dehydrogenase
MTQIGWVCMNLILRNQSIQWTPYLTDVQYGLGSMGLAMANNLQRHLAAKKALSLLYTNRTMSRGSPLQSIGGIPEPSFDKLVSRCGIIFTMVHIMPGKCSTSYFSPADHIPGI